MKEFYLVNFIKTPPQQLAFLVAAILLFALTPVFAQDGEPVVVDEVVAQVNETAITLSRVKREMKFAVDAMVQQGKSREDAQREIESRRAEIIATIINEELLLQKGKEMGLDEEVEAEINQRFLAIMKENKMKTLTELYTEMRKSGLDPEEIRASMRKEIMKNAVLQNDVDRRLFWGFTPPEVKEYYAKNSDKFKKPETIALSEIFISFAGRPETEVYAKADDIIKQARSGKSFTELVTAFSERAESAKNGGKVGTFIVPDLNELFVNAIKNVKVGDVTEPIKLDEGLLILRVDERTAASNSSQFDENRVRQAMMMERAAAERKKYIKELREDAYIKISDGYRAAVVAFLYKDDKN